MHLLVYTGQISGRLKVNFFSRVGIYTTLMFYIFFPDINDCEKNGCMNNATCQDGVNSYDCLCRPGFTGDMCETSKIIYIISKTPKQVTLGPLLQQTFSSDWKAIATNRIHSNDLEACGM